LAKRYQPPPIKIVVCAYEFPDYRNALRLVDYCFAAKAAFRTESFTPRARFAKFEVMETPAKKIGVELERSVN